MKMEEKLQKIKEMEGKLEKIFKNGRKIVEN